jgi:hypothetical protein
MSWAYDAHMTSQTESVVAGGIVSRASGVGGGGGAAKYSHIKDSPATPLPAPAPMNFPRAARLASPAAATAAASTAVLSPCSSLGSSRFTAVPTPLRTGPGPACGPSPPLAMLPAPDALVMWRWMWAAMAAASTDVSACNCTRWQAQGRQRGSEGRHGEKVRQPPTPTLLTIKAAPTHHPHHCAGEPPTHV